jgi:hypothetical protein
MKSSCCKRRSSIEPESLHWQNESRWCVLRPGTISAMISSTAVDLPEHRQQAREACLCEGIFPEGMESLPARDADAIRVSLEMVDRSSIYIGIFAWRYGHIPKGHEISITEMEFDRALQRGIPILVFVAHKDHALTIGQVEPNQGAQKKLKRLKERACKGRTRCEFKSPAELRAEIIHALSALKQREQQSMSPTDAIRAEKERLEKLDPRFSVDITATAQSMHFRVRPIEPIRELPALKFLTEGRTGQLRAFFEKGESFQVNATDIQAEDWPIIGSLLQGLGEANVTITNAIELRGCLQFAFRSSQGELMQVQVDGKWLLAPKRALFTGQLSESPLYVECVRDGGGPGEAQPSRIGFRIEWNAWKGQALLGLAYISQMREFLGCSEFMVRSFVRGNQPWPAETVRVVDPRRQKATEAIDWLLKSRQAAAYLGVNPPFPRGETINAKEAEFKNVALMVKLIESGFHEQTIAGETFAFAGDSTSDHFKVGTEGLSGKWTEPYREISFFGLTIPFGPLVHTWTDVQLVAVRPLPDNRQELEFRGGAKSTWRIDYVRPSPAAPSSPSAPSPPKP